MFGLNARRHAKTSFYKYVSIDVAKIILVNRTLRWSSPVLFDDSFDVPRMLADGLKPSEMRAYLYDRLVTMIENNEALSDEIEPRVKFLVNIVKNADRKDFKEEIVKGINELKHDLVQTFDGLDELRKLWNEMIPTFRILCFSASNKILEMWERYAANYKGVVLEFTCLPEFDSPWFIAEPVKYTDKAVLLDEKGWGELLTLNQDAASRYLFHEYCHTKTTAWAYQEEWRIVSFSSRGGSGLFSDYKFHPPELTAVYLGPKMIDEDIEIIVSMLNYDLSHIKLFQASFLDENEIEFQELNSKK